MDDTLFKSILAMDAYNRGYNAGIDLTISNVLSLGINNDSVKDKIE